MHENLKYVVDICLNEPYTKPITIRRSLKPSTKQRSPVYPAIGLSEVIDLAQKLYREEKRGSFPPEVAATAWGYQGFSGPVRSKFSALKQFGILDQKKGHEARLTDVGVTFAIGTVGSPEYARALKEAALEPPLFRQLYDDRLESSDDTIFHDLVVNQKFTDNGARAAIKAFRESIDTAYGTSIDILSQGGEVESDPETTSLAAPSNVSPRGGPENVIPLPLSPEKWVQLQGQFPITEDEWDRMLSVLSAIKPGLVSCESDVNEDVSCASEV